MRVRYWGAILFSVVMLLGLLPAAIAQTGEVSVELLANGTLVVLGGSGDDLIVAEATASNVLQVDVDQASWSFPADEVTSIRVETLEGDDRVFVGSALPSWTLDGVSVDLGEGTGDQVRLGVSSPDGGANSLTITGSVRTRGGTATISAGSETGSSLFTIGGDVIQIGGPGGDSLGIETEFPTGEVSVAGDVRLLGGDGADYAELNANGVITVAGSFMVLGQQGEDYVWLGGAAGGRVFGPSRLFGGPDFDTIEFDNFAASSVMIKQFEESISSPGVIVPARITVEKEADPPDGTKFPFTLSDPGGTSWKFWLADAGTGDGWSLEGLLLFDTYLLEELTPVGWQLDAVVCFDSFYEEDPVVVGGNPATIDIREASDITCTYVNSAA
jgi:hypothetical protein